jgi:diguanylate cyclase (GGDEF)-like protein
VAFLPGVDELSARSIGERLRQQIAALQCESTPGERVNLSISVGIATYPAHPAQVDELLRAADEALYAAKRNGRNRVELAGAR